MVCAWRSSGDPELTIEKLPQRSGPDKFAVRRLGMTLGLDGWRHEPSSRTDEYMALHRFESFERAHECIRQWRDAGGVE